MRVLITGSGGQLASEFMRAFNEKAVEHLALSKEELDICNLKKVKEVIGEYAPDFIFNCAAYNAVDKAEENWRTAFLVNGTGARNLIIASEESGSILVHYSSDYVFDGGRETPYTIADRPNPINAYGMSKLLGEECIARAGYPRYYLIRASWVFGEGENSFPRKLLDWAEKGKEIKVVEDQISSPSYTEDLVKGTLRLIETGSYGLYHMSNSGACSRYEWAKFILEAINWDGKLLSAKSADFPTPARRPAYSVLDNFPLEQTTGFLPPHWRDATERFLKRKGLI